MKKIYENVQTSKRMKPLSQEEFSRFRALKKLGGPIRVEDMDEYPTFEQWARFFLYAQDTQSAMTNTVNFFAKGVKRPLADIDIEGVGLKI